MTVCVGITQNYNYLCWTSHSEKPPMESRSPVDLGDSQGVGHLRAACCCDVFTMARRRNV
jgi:hypothetical protein